jgi:hypothetical protein
MERLPPHGCVPGEIALLRGIDSVFHGGRTQHAGGGGKVIGESLGDDRCAPYREVRAALLAGAHGDYQSGVGGHHGRDLRWSHFFHAPGMNIHGARWQGHFE